MKKVIQKLNRRQLTLLILSAPFIFVFAFWLAGELLIVRRPLPKADAAFVLAGNLYWGERSHRAAELYREGRVNLVVLTSDSIQAGWESDLQRNPYFWEWERWYLIGQGVPESSIIVLPGNLSGTQSEAVLLANAARERGWQKVVIVTSPLHTARTFWATRRVFARDNLAVEIGVEPSRHPNDPPFWWTLRRNWKMVVTEYVKFVYYWLFY